MIGVVAGRGLTTKSLLSVFEQPVPQAVSVTVTVFVPGVVHLTVIELPVLDPTIVPPADTVQLYVLQPTCGVLYITTEEPSLTQTGSSLGVITGAGNGFTTTSTVVEAVQPFEFVTDNVYVPAAACVTLFITGF